LGGGREEERVLYSAAQRGLNVAYQGMLVEPDRPFELVLISAGPGKGGINQDTFERSYAVMTSRIGTLKRVPVHTIAVTEDAVEPLAAIAALTGGRALQGNPLGMESLLRTLRSF
jgi:hypothetical protein